MPLQRLLSPPSLSCAKIILSEQEIWDKNIWTGHLVLGMGCTVFLFRGVKIRFGITKRKGDFVFLFRYNEKNIYICGVGFGITKRYEYNQEADIFG